MPEQQGSTDDFVKELAKRAHDVDAVRKSVEDAASISGTLWFSYLFTLFYIGIAAGSVTHRDLLLENSVKLPFLNIDLPLVAFFLVTPILFFVSHAYALTHFVLLAAKVGTFNAAIENKLPKADVPPAENSNTDRAMELQEARVGLRRQLPSNIFVQFLAGPSEVRDGLLGWLLQATAWVSLVIGPVFLLLLLQVQFLPYHLALVTWVQRLTLVADVILLWFLWPAVLAGRAEILFLRPWRHPGLALLCLIPIGFAFTAATFPGQLLDAHVGERQWVPLNRAAVGLSKKDSSLKPKWTSFHDLFFKGDVDAVTRRRTSLFSNTLVLNSFDALKAANISDPKELDKGSIKNSLTLRGRHLEGAVFDGADLRAVDFKGAHLGGAFFREAHLQGATLDEAELQDAILVNAHLQGASLDRAHIQGAHLEGASLKLTQIKCSYMADPFQLSQASVSIENCGRLEAVGPNFARFQIPLLRTAELQGEGLDKVSGRLSQDPFITARQAYRKLEEKNPKKPCSNSSAESACKSPLMEMNKEPLVLAVTVKNESQSLRYAVVAALYRTGFAPLVAPRAHHILYGPPPVTNRNTWFHTSGLKKCRRMPPRMRNKLFGKKSLSFG